MDNFSLLLKYNIGHVHYFSAEKKIWLTELNQYLNTDNKIILL